MWQSGSGLCLSHNHENDIFKMRNLHGIVKFGGKMDTLYNANYFIMVAEDMGFVIDHMGSTRIVGYYGELEIAPTAVKENRCDIRENIWIT